MRRILIISMLASLALLGVVGLFLFGHLAVPPTATLDDERCVEVDAQSFCLGHSTSHLPPDPLRHAVAPDGREFRWYQLGTHSVATVSRDGVVERVSDTVEGRWLPRIAFVGRCAVEFGPALPRLESQELPELIIKSRRAWGFHQQWREGPVLVELDIPQLNSPSLSYTLVDEPGI